MNYELLQSEPLRVIQSTDEVLSFHFREPVKNTAGAIVGYNDIDITDWVITLSVKQRKSDLDIDAIILVTQNTHFSATLGKTQIELNQSQTSRPGKYVYELRLTDQNGKLGKTYAGQFWIEEDV
jgi:hypothetical protein